MKEKNDLILPVGAGDLNLAAHLFSPQRLTLARELRGFTKAELAERIGKSATAIGQFEGGGRVSCHPDPKTLGSIALALGIPIAFFTRKGPSKLLEVDACHFRSLRSASQRERKKLLASGSLLCDLMNFLECHVVFPNEEVTIATRPAVTESDIEECAVHVRKTWGLGLGPINNVVNLLETHGVFVSHIPDSCADVDAFSTWNEGRPLVFLVMYKGSPSRTRFDACHELGHLIMHADVTAANPQMERQANRFASAFLLPRESFLPECPRRLNWGHFYELKRRWKVSVSALVRRAFDLECISEATYRRAYMYLNKTGERLQERDEPALEMPTLIGRAVEALKPDFSLQDLADHVGLTLSDLSTLLGPADAMQTT